MNAPFRLNLCIASLVLLVGCSDDGNETVVATGGTGAGTGGDNGTGATGPGTGGDGPGTGGAQGSGAANQGSGGGSPGGGTQNTGGNGPGSGGTPGGTGGNSGTGGASTVDQAGKDNAALGETSDLAQDYLKLGEIRILNNNWGSEDLGCNDSTFQVFVDQDSSFGWNFSRGDCAANGEMPDTSHPDFPQVEFGIHPFGIGDDLVTSPEFSSTPLLPIQLKDIQSASVTLDNLSINLQNGSSWNLTMEFWLSEGDPRQPSGSVDVHTELMAWWGWNNGRWPCNVNPDQVNSGGKNYTLCHQDDQWAGGQWRYFQFRAGDGSDANISTSFTGPIDVKSFLDYLTNRDAGTYHGDLWLTRMEVGSEIDDDTSGTVRMNNITFEVNGQSRSAEFAQ